MHLNMEICVYIKKSSYKFVMFILKDDFVSLLYFYFKCMDICLAANYTKPGNCPGENPMSPFEAACVTACNSDSQCTDVAKCCSNNCGITCMRPLGLEKWEGNNYI